MTFFFNRFNLAVLLSFSFYASQAQGIVNDTTKVLYGTTTTDVFDQSIIYRERRVFFNKDTFFIVQPAQVKLNFKYSVERPFLYTPEELKEIEKKELRAKAIADSIEQASKLDTNIYVNTKVKEQKKNIFSSVFTKQTKLKTKEDTINYERKLRFYKNRYNYYRPDTSIEKLQQYHQIFVKKNFFQNLGVLGTPSNPVYPIINRDIGYQSGFNVVNQWHTPQDKVKYYNTRSPYTDFYYVGFPGTTEEDRAKIDVNRNITRNTNVGMSYERIDSRKSIGRSSSINRNLLLSQEFLIYFSGRSKNDRYHFMGNFSYFVYKINEQGGLSPINPLPTTTEEPILPQNEVPLSFNSWPVVLNSPRFSQNPWENENSIFTRDRRVGYHFYHQYDILNLGRLSVFHEFNRSNQKYTYADPTVDNTIAGFNFYKGNKISTDTVSNSLFFNQEFEFLSNKVGLKSKQGKWTFLGYTKFRNGNQAKRLNMIMYNSFFSDFRDNINSFFINNPKNGNFNFNERYLGGETILDINDSLEAYIQYDQLVYSRTTAFDSIIGNEFRPRNDYFFSLGIKSKNKYGLSFVTTRKSPTIAQLNSLDHLLYRWSNNFAPILMQNINAFANGKLLNQDFTLELNLYRFQNYVYFADKPSRDSTSYRFGAYQESRAIGYGTLDISYNVLLWKIRIDNSVKYTYLLPNQPDVIRLPMILYNPKIFFQYIPIKKVNRQEFRIGFDIYYWTAFFANAYNPGYGQFYVQDDFKMNYSFLVDLFLVAKMRNAKVFFKINQFNKMLNLTRGIYISPYHPAPNSQFAFGVNWLLFD